jgi:transcriptional regulator with XRE-family HTH domain
MAHGLNDETVVDGAAVRRLRCGGYLSLRALAQKCEAAGQQVDHSQLSKIERGLCQPRLQLLRALTEALSEVHGKPVNILKPAEEVDAA